MKNKIPLSCKVFVIVISITALVLIAATLFAHYQINKKYSIILAFLMFVAFAFTTVGIYGGLKLKTNENGVKLLNRIGIIGNLLVFMFVVILMVFAAFVEAKT